MKASTVRTLNAINRLFYATVAADFDVTRAKAWRGWREILPHIPIPPDRPLTVLDVGCGNGRFAAYLAERLNTPIVYHGVDSSAALLNIAVEQTRGVANLTATWETRDVIENPPQAGAFDLVVAFGLLHHVPGNDQRLAFVRALADRVKCGGLLVWTEWRFYEYERFRTHLVSMPADLADDVQVHDYLLDWGASPDAEAATSIRYCHYIDDDESQRLSGAVGLQTITTYRADGGTRDANHYVLMRRSLHPCNE